MKKKWCSKKKALASRENGKLGGRPKDSEEVALAKELKRLQTKIWKVRDRLVEVRKTQPE